MFLDKTTWNSIFSAIDLNSDNVITLQEFEYFLYPEKQAEIDGENDKKSDEHYEKIIAQRGEEEVADRILDVINPQNSHPNHLSSEDFFG